MRTVKNYLVKRNPYASPLLALPVVCLMIAEYLAYISSHANDTYAITALDEVMVLTEISAVLILVVLFAGIFLKGEASMIVLDALRMLAVALICMCFYIVLEQRATLMGYVWFSSLESGNANSVKALNYGVASAALYAFSLILLAISGAAEFVTCKKYKKTRAQLEQEIGELQSELANAEE